MIYCPDLNSFIKSQQLVIKQIQFLALKMKQDNYAIATGDRGIPGQKLKKKRAEQLLEKKYYETLDLIQAMRNDPKGGKSRTSVSIKKKRVDYEDDPFDDDSKTKNFKVGDNELEVGGKTNLVVNINKQEVTEGSDFLQAKFGVQSHLPSAQTLERGQDSDVKQADNAVSHFNIQEDPNLPSLTNQIFIQDKKTVLPLETANTAAVSTVAGTGYQREKNSLDPRLAMMGFRDYIEQEELDRATVNDFISSKQSIKLSRAALLPAPILGDNRKSVRYEDEIAEQRVEKSEEPSQQQTSDKTQDNKVEAATGPITSHILHRKSTADSGNNMASIVSGDRQNSRRDSTISGSFTGGPKTDEIMRTTGGISKYQGGVTPNEFHLKSATEKRGQTTEKNERKPEDRRFSNNVMVTIEPIEAEISQKEFSVASQKSPSILRKDDSQKKFGSDFDVSEMVKSDIHSNMGRYVRTLQPGEEQPQTTTPGLQYGVTPTFNVPMDLRTVELPSGMKMNQLSKFKGAQTTKNSMTIHQDSFMIQHDFDAGKSKITQRLDLQRKAQIKMAQLTAMLRHKDPNKHLYLSEYGESSQNDQIEVEDVDAGGKEGKDDEENQDEKTATAAADQSIMENGEKTSNGAGQSQEGEEKPFKYQPVRSMSFHSSNQGRKRFGSDRYKSKDYDGIQQQIRRQMTKGPNKRDSIQIDAAGGLQDGIGQNGSDYDSQALNPWGTKPSRMGTLPSKVHGNIDQDRNNHDSLAAADSALGASQLEKLADDEHGLKRNDSSMLKFNESLNPIISKSLNTSYLRNAIAKARKAELGLKVNRQGSDLATKPGKIKKQIINTGFLTSVPKRGKMIDTQKYIRHNLLPYADNEYFGFTPKPRELKPIAVSARNKGLFLGEVDKSLRTIDQTAFYSPLNMTLQYPSVAQSQTLQTGKRGKSLNKKMGESQPLDSSQNYEPIIMPKKRQQRSLRIRKRNNRYDSNKPNEPKDPKGMTMITEEPADQANEIEVRDEMEILMEENLDLMKELEDMVIVFEQYMKVAALKKKADSLNSPLESDDDSDAIGGAVPQMDDQGRTIEIIPDGESAADDRTMYDSGGKPANQSRLMDFQMSSQPNMLSDQQLQTVDDVSPHRSQAVIENQENLKILTAPFGDSIGQLSGQRDSLENGLRDSIEKPNRSAMKSKTRNGTAEKSVRYQQRKEKMVASLQLKEAFFMNHHMPFIKSPDGTAGVMVKKSRHQELMGLTMRSFATAKTSRISTVGDRSPKQQSLPLSPRYQIKPSGYSILAVNEHKTHNEWLRKIQALWEKMLSLKYYDELIRVEQELDGRKKKLYMLQQENLRNNAKLTDLKYKTVDKTRAVVKSNQTALARRAEKYRTKLAKLQEKVKIEQDRKNQLSVWGLSSYFIQLIMDIRIVEDLIDLAQRQRVRPDATVEREMYLMRYLQYQTQKDVHVFLRDRDREYWRTWDNPRLVGFVKPDATEHPDEAKLRTIINFIYHMETEIRIHARICQEMVVFLNYCFGSEAWYTLWKLKWHRESNRRRQAEIEEDIQTSPRRRAADVDYADPQEDGSLNWLQLTENHEDMIIVGPEPLWLKYVKQEEMRKKMREGELGNQTSDTVLNHGDQMISIQVEQQEPHPMPSKGYDDMEDELVVMGTDQEDGAHDVLSRGSYERQNAEREEELARLRDAANEENQETEEEKRQREMQEKEALETLRREQEEIQRKEDEELLRIRKQWNDVIESNKAEDEQRKKQLEEGRAKRLARLFRDDFNSDNEEDDEEPLYRHLDHGAATSGIDELIDKVEVHLQVEMGILRKWQEKDFAMIKEQSRSHFPMIKQGTTNLQQQPFQNKVRAGQQPSQQRKANQDRNSLLDRRAFGRSIDRDRPPKTGQRQSKQNFYKQELRQNSLNRGRGDSQRSPQPSMRIQRRPTKEVQKSVPKYRSRQQTGHTFDEKDNPYLPPATTK